MIDQHDKRVVSFDDEAWNSAGYLNILSLIDRKTGDCSVAYFMVQVCPVIAD